MKVNYRWNKELYNEFLTRLINNGEEHTKEFNSKIINTKYEMLGIKTPTLRMIAKEISKSDFISFLDLCTDKYYEEVLIHGFVISYIKDFDTFMKYFNNYILKIDNWALCDSCISSYKIIKDYDFSSKAISLINTNIEYLSRVGYIILLNYYIDDDHIDDIISYSTIPSEHYYVNMAIAWLLATAFVSYRENVLDLLKSKKLSPFLQNKTISKIRESLKVSKEDKALVNKYKIKEKY